MEPKTIRLVQSSWRQILLIATVFGPLLYRRLFEASPQLRALFKGDIDQQSARLLQMIDMAVDSLDQLDSLMPALHQLGQQHQGYGVDAEDYERFGAALLQALGQSLGSGFTPQIRNAWVCVYGVIAGTMCARAAGLCATLPQPCSRATI